MAAPGTDTKNDNGTVKFTTLQGCMGCGNRVSVDQLDPGALEAWRAGMGNVQDLFPRLSASEREALMTGTHAECWDAVAGYADEPEAEEDDMPPCAVCGESAERECAACDNPLCDEHARTTSVPGDTFCQTGVGCQTSYGA
jgi:hypothetical protein